MNTTEVASFLNERGHGVLAFGTAEAYAIPISFAYEEASNRCIVQLYHGSTSRKRNYIERSNDVCLVVHEWHNLTDWQSVIITGQLRRVPKDE
jgi:nitroimidazol reductase NimA-like FMN-containing flavoprotein (pyridoxamine 5'-phosphate oxidase superfamily)